MSVRKKIAFAIYFLNCLSLVGFGAVYFFSPTLMSYHQQVIGRTWEELGTGIRIIFHAMLKATGAGFLVTGISGLLLLFIPFKRGEDWASWALPFILLFWNAGVAYVSAGIALKAGVVTPWPIPVLGMVMLIVALIFSPPSAKKFVKYCALTVDLTKRVAQIQITPLGAATVILEIDSLRLLTDPVFDPAGGRYSFGWGTGSKKLTAPAIAAEKLGRIDAVLLSHDHHGDNLDCAGERSCRRRVKSSPRHRGRGV
jgi:hypothetical protein